MKLIERIAFDFPKQEAIGAGGTVNGWTEGHATRAHFHYLRGGESVMAGRLSGKQPVIVTIRECGAARGITTGWRMRDLRSGVVYNVRTNAPMQDSRLFRELLCESGVAV